ncbi:MAG: transposase [Betaproteobacteria bacterium RIFCSPLOWO2_12_FULL_62_13]|nr:MAG: transposase [Betaproteobacteria bacterium RIFCSPLOWO2_12_FULL_62_13]
MGEAKKRRAAAVREVLGTLGVETLGGRVQVRWNQAEAATPFGQMAYFAEFLNLTGLYRRWVESCPLRYASPNGSKIADVLGTLFLSVLSGHWRYAHIAALRADGVSAALLGMEAVVSEDTVRRALRAIKEAAGVSWLQEHVDASVLALLAAPWILDIDATVKPLYGKQEGAIIGYNPHKPGRPSHVYHTYQMAGLRLMLGVTVAPGNKSHANTTLPGLIELIERLPPEKRPALVRGDCGQGGEPTMAALEARDIRYLFKLRLTKNVKRYIERMFASPEWTDAGQGWQGQEGSIQLSGWSRPRRIVILRRPLQREMLLADSQQLQLAFVEKEVPAKGYEYAVLVTDLAHEIRTIAQFYRDRGDAENAFDELKNQWGWGGFTTQDLKRCRLSAMTVALAYNWWSLFVRLAHPKARLEAITSRPFLLSGIGRLTSHAGQAHLSITPMHARANEARAFLTAVSQRLKQWKHAAEQLNFASVWQRVCEFIATEVTGFNWLARRIQPLLPRCT